MSFPVQDAFWTETATFVRNAIGQEVPFIGPREFRSVLPRVFSYDFVHAVEVLGQFSGVIIHKGLLHELPLPVLQTMKNEWKCVFANEVFLFFMPADSALPAATETHQQHFHDCLLSMEKSIEVKKQRVAELTALLVIAAREPFFLDKTLRSLSLLHLPVLVVASTSDPTRRKAYRSICSIHHAKLDALDKNTTPAKALKTGIEQLLEDIDIAWISSFDDSMVARPDFLFVMEKFRNAETCPVLGGLWTEADGIRTSCSRDGLRLIIPQKQPGIHVYGHREYWKRRFFPTDNLPPFDSGFIIENLVALQAAT